MVVRKLVEAKMKKVSVLIVILSTLILIGCSQGKNFTIESKEFTDEQNEILSLTGNRAFKCDLKNLPKDKNYELNVVYEVYQGKEKVKEEIILGMAYEATEDKIEDRNLSINIQENKIRAISDGAYSYLDIEEDISKLVNYYFSGNTKINIGDQIYLFHGSDGKYLLPTEKSLGLVSNEELEKLIEENEVNIFIKLVCKEISK